MTTAAQTNLKTDAPPVRAYLVLAMGIAAVALAAILIRLALNEGVPALVVAASRLVLAALMLTPLTLQRYSGELRHLKRDDILLLLVSGIFLSIHFAAWVSSLQYTSVLISGVLVVTTPIWAGLLEVFVLKTRLTWTIFAGLVVALIGSLMIAVPGGNATTTQFDDTALFGAGLALIGAMTVAVYMIIGRKLRPRLSLLPYIWSVYGTAAVILTIVVLLNGLPITGYSSEAYLWMFLLALFPQLIGHSSLNYALGYLPATYVSIATQLEPILSAIVAFFLFSEAPGWAQVAGSMVIMAGVTLATLQPRFGRREVKTID
jgi:drug/metabolite transporter (DMT)-like permease